MHAEDLSNNKIVVDAVFNSDIVGNSRGGNGVVDAETVRVYAIGPEDSPARSLARFIERTAGVFREANENFAKQHSADDTLDGLDFGYLAQNARVKRRRGGVASKNSATSLVVAQWPLAWMVTPRFPVWVAGHWIVQLGRVSGFLLISLPGRRGHGRRLTGLRRGVVGLAGMRCGVVRLDGSDMERPVSTRR